MIRKSDFSIETYLGWVVGNDCIDMSCLNASEKKSDFPIFNLIQDGHFVLMVLTCLVLRSVGKEREIFMTQLRTSLVLEMF